MAKRLTETLLWGVRHHLDPLGILICNIKWNNLGGDQCNTKPPQGGGNAEVTSVQFWPQPLTWATALWLQPTNAELQKCCSEKQTRGARLAAIVVRCSVVSGIQLKRQRPSMTFAIPYFHETRSGFTQTIFRLKGVPHVLSGFGLYAQTIWNFVGRTPVSHNPDWDHPLISHSEESSCQTVTAFIH